MQLLINCSISLLLLLTASYSWPGKVDLACSDKIFKHSLKHFRLFFRCCLADFLSVSSLILPSINSTVWYSYKIIPLLQEKPGWRRSNDDNTSSHNCFFLCNCFSLRLCSSYPCDLTQNKHQLITNYYLIIN